VLSLPHSSQTDLIKLLKLSASCKSSRELSEKIFQGDTQSLAASLLSKFVSKATTMGKKVMSRESVQVFKSSLTHCVVVLLICVACIMQKIVLGELQRNLQNEGGAAFSPLPN